MNEKQIRKIWKKIKKYPNVVGFDSSLRPRKKNKREIPNTKCLRIYVKTKLPKSYFKNHDGMIPRTIEGFETDIEEIGLPRALAVSEDEDSESDLKDPKKRYRPYIAGTSACHYKCTACTSTAFFKDKETSKILFGLNNHCGCQENKAKIGDPWLQPGPYDGGKYPDDIVARLYRCVEIKFNEFTCPYRNFFHKIYRFFKGEQFNKVDICFGEPSVFYGIKVLNISSAFKGVKEPEIGMQVQKMGRTSGYTKGEIVSTSWTGRVQYSRGIAMFTDCILVEGKGFSAGGDSSSPVFDMEGNLIGILFAGSDTHTILCKIKNIEEEGKVEVITLES